MTDTALPRMSVCGSLGTLRAHMVTYESAAEYGGETECTNTPCASGDVLFVSLCSVPAFLRRASEFRYMQPTCHLICVRTICSWFPRSVIRVKQKVK